MRSVIRWLGRVALALVALIAGCWWDSVGRSMYGIEPEYGIPPPPHDPTVTLEEFSYSPAVPVEPGAEIQFTAATSKPTQAGAVQVRIGAEAGEFIWLHDNGNDPDQVAGDGIWVGEWVAPGRFSPGIQPVAAWLVWWDGHPGQELSGLPLTIVEPEEE